MIASTAAATQPLVAGLLKSCMVSPGKGLCETTRRALRAGFIREHRMVDRALSAKRAQFVRA
jgi:hypothetical protein